VYTPGSVLLCQCTKYHILRQCWLAWLENTLNINIVLYYILGAKIVKHGLNFYKNEYKKSFSLPPGIKLCASLKYVAFWEANQPPSNDKTFTSMQAAERMTTNCK